MSYLRRFLVKDPEILSVVLLGLIAYAPIFAWMWERWFEQKSYYSHGILIPFVSLALVFFKRDKLSAMPRVSSVWGLRLFVVAILLYWVAAILHFYFIAGFSLLVLMAAIILHFYGVAALGEVSFPLFFLIFMIPLPLIMMATMGFNMKILAASLATLILNVVQLPAVQMASLIKMRHTYVVVEDSCGGLSFLISLNALAAIIAHQMKAGFIRKVALFASSFPIAVITNALRIVFLGSVGEVYGIQYARGLLHNLSGFMIFILAFLLLYLLEKILEETDV